MAPQTFIRGAAGKALTDSPALNPLSRQVLVPVARTHLLPPTTIRVPGPVDPRVANPPPVAPPPRQNGASLPAALAPSASQASTASATQDLLGGEEDGEAGEHDQEDLERAEAVVPAANDPYAALDSAFGGYLADAPRPQQHTADDLLF